MAGENLVGRDGIAIDTVCREINMAMQQELAKGGAVLDAIYYCPHLPDEGCECRKPKTGMIENAMRDFPIDRENSWMIGDKAIDVEVGKNAGLKTALVLTGYGQREVDSCEPDIVAENLFEAVTEIIKQR